MESFRCFPDMTTLALIELCKRAATAELPNPPALRDSPRAASSFSLPTAEWGAVMSGAQMPRERSLEVVAELMNHMGYQP